MWAIRSSRSMTNPRGFSGIYRSADGSCPFRWQYNAVRLYAVKTRARAGSDIGDRSEAAIAASRWRRVNDRHQDRGQKAQLHRSGLCERRQTKRSPYARRLPGRQSSQGNRSLRSTAMPDSRTVVHLSLYNHLNEVNGKARHLHPRQYGQDVAQSGHRRRRRGSCRFPMIPIHRFWAW